MTERETIRISLINTRQCIPQEAIDDVVDQIVQHYQPHKIILLTLGDPFLREIVNKGKILYERIDH